MRYVLGSRASIGGVLGSGRGGAAAALPVTGAVLWLDASQITGLSDGAAITTWPDMSGNGYNATQTGASTLKPTYKTSILNGKPVARFDGGDWLALTDTLTITSLSVFVVWKSAGTNGRMVDMRGTGANGAAIGWHIKQSNPINNEIITFDNGAGAFRQLQNVTPSTTDFHIYAGTYSAGIPGLWLDGVPTGTLVSVGTMGSISTTKLLHIGTNVNGQSTQFYTGDIAEIILYDSALGTTDRQATQTYLGTKYGITVS